MRGSVTNILSPAGTVVKGYDYDEFGQSSKKGDDNFLNEMTFTGSVMDASSGLQYMNARYYQPSTGRFLSQDTYSGNPYDPWTHHLYVYTGNNPINFIDPTGHSIESLQRELEKATFSRDVYHNAMKNYDPVKDAELYLHANDKYREYSLQVNDLTRRLNEARNSWWNTVPENNVTIPSTNDIISDVGSAFVGAGTSVVQKRASQTVYKKWYVENDYIRYSPGFGHATPRAPKVANTFGRASQVITGVTTAVDIANTWTENNGNTNGDRVIKTGIQVAGTVATAAAGVAIFGAANAWNPIGWGALILAGLATVAVSIGVGQLQEVTYDAMGIE